MKHLIEIIYENLNKENLKSLKQYVNDENFHDLLPKLQRAVKELATEENIKGDNNHYNKYFHKHALSNDVYEKKPNIGHIIASIFIDNDEVEEFNDIINNNGIISFEDLKTHNNLFDICKNTKVLNGKLIDFEKSAKKISEIDNIKCHKVNVGQGEILLKFILKDNILKVGKGDISLENNINIEVKGGNDYKHSGSIGKNIHSIVSTSNEFLNYLQISSKYTGNPGEQFLASGNANKALEKLLNDNNISDINLIIESFVKAYIYQYMLDKSNENISNDKINKAKNIIDIIKTYNNDTKTIILDNDNKIKINNSLTEMIGLTQLYLYSIVENFNYLFVFNQKTGDYKLIEIVNDYKEIINSIIFYFPEGGSKATGRRCASRVFPKKNNK